jgi:hypothetical protein
VPQRQKGQILGAQQANYLVAVESNHGQLTGKPEVNCCNQERPCSQAGRREMREREAQRLLQPYLDRVNASIAAPSRQHKSTTFEAFSEIWERDYLSLSKPSTQATMRGQVKQLKLFFGGKELRQIGVADIQRLVAQMEAEESVGVSANATQANPSGHFNDTDLAYKGYSIQTQINKSTNSVDAYVVDSNQKRSLIVSFKE